MNGNPLYRNIDSLVLLIDPDHNAPWTLTHQAALAIYTWQDAKSRRAVVVI